MNECIYCKSTEIEKDLPIISKEYIGSSSPGLVGPYFSTGTKKFLGQLQTHCKQEPMYMDLCKQCGGVKLHVKNMDRDWQKEFPSARNGVIFV